MALLYFVLLSFSKWQFLDDTCRSLQARNWLPRKVVETCPWSYSTFEQIWPWATCCDSEVGSNFVIALCWAGGDQVASGLSPCDEGFLRFVTDSGQGWRSNRSDSSSPEGLLVWALHWNRRHSSSFTTITFGLIIDTENQSAVTSTFSFL